MTTTKPSTEPELMHRSRFCRVGAWLERVPYALLAIPLVLPPELAAYMAVSIELSTPVLLVLGLATRPAAFVLLAMTSIIEIFVYPQAWPTHIQWAAMLLVLLCRGSGKWSLDHLIRQKWVAAR
jgi:putative oxidoreductase